MPNSRSRAVSKQITIYFRLEEVMAHIGTYLGFRSFSRGTRGPLRGLFRLLPLRGLCRLLPLGHIRHAVLPLRQRFTFYLLGIIL